MIKASKASVHYTDIAMDEDEQCRHCKHFEKPDSCKIVLGRIKPGGWCEEFENESE